MAERYAPGGPLALAVAAIAEQRYDVALDRLEELLAIARGQEDGKTRDHVARLAARIAEEAAGLRERADRVVITARNW